MFRAFSRGLSITRVRVSTNPFHGNDDAIRTDDTSLQRRIVKHATFKERAENPGQESYLYRERRGTVLKSRKHWNVYKKWTEAEHDKVSWVLKCQKVKQCQNSCTARYRQFTRSISSTFIPAPRAANIWTRTTCTTRHSCQNLPSPLPMKFAINT